MILVENKTKSIEPLFYEYEYDIYIYLVLKSIVLYLDLIYHIIKYAKRRVENLNIKI